MFDNLKAFFEKITHQGDAIHFEENDHRLAVAALLAHVMYSDGFVRESERDAIRTALQTHYHLNDSEIEELIKQGEEADQGAIDFYTFTSVLKRTLDREECKNIVEMMWDVVLADGVIHELEDTVVWRVAELLGIETRERITLRQKVEAKRMEQS